MLWFLLQRTRLTRHGRGRAVTVSAAEPLTGILAGAIKRYHGAIGAERAGEPGKGIISAARMTIAYLTAGFIVGIAIKKPSKHPYYGQHVIIDTL
jgi:hypothetical protein